MEEVRHELLLEFALPLFASSLGIYTEFLLLAPPYPSLRKLLLDLLVQVRRRLALELLLPDGAGLILLDFLLLLFLVAMEGADVGTIRLQ